MSAVTVAAVATVASAGVAAYSASQQAKAAKENSTAMTGSKVAPVPYKDNVGGEDSYAQELYGKGGDMEAFMKGGLPMTFDIARKVQAFNDRKREKETGGTFKSTIQQEGGNILAMERGQVPQDVIDSVNRIVAENLGGAVDPGAAGGNGFGNSTTANSAARNLGLTSLDLMKTGMSFGPSWRTNADSFLYKPADAARDFFFPAAQVALNASKIQLEEDQNQYVSDNNIARAAAMPDPNAVGGLNNQLQANAAIGQGVSNVGSALAGLVHTFSGPSASSASYGPTSTWQKPFDTNAGAPVPISSRPPGWAPAT